ncbi:MAG: glycosyltransferase, partial [Oscillospiraceae bacterium]|nr:glycosyltransferase [Oscillospiraceae bacterium]
MYTVSIVIPVYNRQETIEFCLDSLKLQSLSQDNFEVIVVDDCSTDKTLAVLKKYKKIKNFRVVSLEENSGTPAAPRNKGIELATGKYIMFVDSDDIVTPFSLEYMSDMAERSDADFIMLFPFPSGRKKFTERYINYYNDVEPVDINADREMNNRLFRNVTVFN